MLCKVFLGITAVDCGALDNPSNGAVDTLSGTTFMNNATYTCNPGYTLMGSNTRTCQAGGEWNSTSPTCRGKLGQQLLVTATNL